MFSDALQIIDSPSGITDVPGFFAGAAACDVRQKGDLERKDVAVLFSKTPCSAAGVFTLNDVKAAPVLQCQEVLKNGTAIHGIVANSGNANAVTGAQGAADADAMASLTEAQLELPEGSVFVASTGRIGRLLPMDALNAGITEACASASETPENGLAAADAILTSDTRNKIDALTFQSSTGKTISFGGIAKGAGMIEPNMATMLAFVATDANISSELLKKALAAAVTGSFNRITVDGDMSTNDTVLVLANGASGATIDSEDHADYPLFVEALKRICYELAFKIVSDGEKITKVVTLEVTGAPSTDAADKVARAIGNSLLVKSSWYGSDPNWGRIVDAAGYARIGIDINKVDLHYDDCPALIQGAPLEENDTEWKQIVANKHFTIRLNLNLGDHSATLLSTDLTEAYVDFNRSE